MSIDAHTLVSRLARLSVADIADQFDRRALVPPVLARELHPVGRAQKFAGVAFCVEGRKLNAAGWLAMPTGRDSLYDGLDERVPAGAVMLLGTGGYDDAAVFGGGTALAMQRRGVAGVIVDGAVRDSEEIAQCALPVLARGVSAIRFVGRFAVTAVDAPIELRGLAESIAARSGDLVLADHDGAIVLPLASAAEIIAATEQAAEINERVTEAVLRGMSRTEAGRLHGKG
ncbi:MAG: RraA family protein [Burkholderiales bacterium]|nr:RraA family protein [Burkholderiales bacterium]